MKDLSFLYVVIGITWGLILLALMKYLWLS